MQLWIRALIAALFLPILAVGVSAQDAEKGGRTRFILAASWEPAFCATNEKKAECRGEKPNGFDATNFSLHGLWPMRQQYCDVAEDLRQADGHSDWNSLPEVPLSAKTRSLLAKAMPGTQSGLERHEWIKHGTCTKLSADDYFAGAVGLIEELNASAVRDLFAQNIGKTLDAEAIKAAFDKSFGEGASERVKMSCRRVGKTRVISELTIGLSEDAIEPNLSGPRLEALIQDAGSTKFGCDQGVVQAVGP
ncbi:ribonuclease [Rhizobium tubonense]|uniref:Ribonuclease n=2 Tax=Rhizobium tubonense TaxID=484088 RepID=A0A2W4CTH2_9HYPH|nr:ribonuclease [Rhizobium tubonense]PZM13665.1 ribonuclease [Rhizobium tubonense]